MLAHHYYRSPAGIGALELKQTYQSSMLAALILAVLFHLCLVGANLIWDATTGTLPVLNPTVEERFREIRFVPSPPRNIGPNLPKSAHPPVVKTSSFGPRVIVDDRVAEDQAYTNANTPPTETPGKTMDNAAAYFGAAHGLGVVAGANHVPEPEEFIPVEFMPVFIITGKPVYPEVAVLTRTEGSVWVQALVGSDGRVHKAAVVKPSGSNVGFEEAALTAAYQSRFKPARQNNRPVAVWVTYEVRFKLSVTQ